MDYYNKNKYYEVLPCKYDPNNEGIGCKQPRTCKRCGWNPSVHQKRMEQINKQHTENVNEKAVTI